MKIRNHKSTVQVSLRCVCDDLVFTRSPSHWMIVGISPQLFELRTPGSLDKDFNDVAEGL